MQEEKNIANTDQEEKTIDSEMIYKGKVLNFRLDQVRLSNGSNSEREIIEHPGGVSILAQTEDRKILLVEQYRKAAEESLLEIPAGKLEKGEDPRECGQRELIEETGYQAGCFEHIVSFYTSPGFCDEIIHLYAASDLKNVGVNPDEDEILKNHSFSKSEINKLLNEGKIKDSKTIIALQYFLMGGFDAR